MSMDADERQEFETLILEGYSPQDARPLARASNDKINGRRLSGPLTGDTIHGNGYRPLISDHRGAEFSEYGQSLGVDSRSVDERESDWETADWAAGIILDIQGALTEKQYRFLQHKFGLDGVEPARSVAELAERIGVSKSTARTMMRPIQKRIFKKLGADYGHAA